MNDNVKVNLGCVVYTMTKAGVKAEWVYHKDGEIEHGNGIGLRLTEMNHKRRFEGDFKITYTDANGHQSPELDLIISFKSGYYHLMWEHNEKTTDIGIGIESDGKLLVSYTEAIKNNFG